MGRGSKRQRKNVARSSIKSKTNEREEETFREEDTDDEIDACKFSALEEYVNHYIFSFIIKV